MKTAKLRWILLFFVVIPFVAYSESTEKDSTALHTDSISHESLQQYKERLQEFEVQRINDSIAKIRLQAQIDALQTTDNLKKGELQLQLEEIKAKEQSRLAEKKAEIDRLRGNTVGYPVTGPLKDTLFYIYNRIAAHSARERAESTSSKIKLLYEDDFLVLDSIVAAKSADGFSDIRYNDLIIMSVSEADALWEGDVSASNELAEKNAEIIRQSIKDAQIETSFLKQLTRIGLIVLILAISLLIIWFINRLYIRALNIVEQNKSKILKALSYKGYTFFSIGQELKLVTVVLKLFKWFFILLVIYFAIPLIFSVFPFTHSWSDYLFGLIWSPFSKILRSIWAYFPRLVTIVVIILVFRYLIKFIKYIFTEISTGKLKISGFYPDWAMTTFHVLRFLLYAFCFVMIFPYLPFSDSPIFTGVSVFLGLLVSLGSSSAIANIIAGLVITYMRPFKIGDRIKLGDTMGDVIEKTILVTRLRTIKNEEITIPNSTILSGNTINYSSFSKTEGLIIHVKITMGYDSDWQEVYAALLESADRTNNVMKTPKPFVLQLSLDDFYVTYQLNAYIQEANKQATIYTELYQNIQNVFNEKGLELLSPYYQANRDGSTSTIPKKYRQEEK